MKLLKKAAKKACIGAVVAALTVGCCIPASAAENVEYLRGTFEFAAHDNNCNLEDSYIYTDSFFESSSYDADIHLAIMSMQLASASISSKDTSDYAQKSENLQDLLAQLGFEDIEVNADYQRKMEINSMGGVAAYKELDDDTVLLAIVPRSAGYEAEWGGNFNVGESGLHEGFQIGRDNILGFTKEYVADHSDAFEGKTVKVWTVGYSRGAAVANLIGAAVVDDSQGFLGLDVDSENVFAYTFGTPLTADASLGTRAKKYNGIHNYYSDYDPIALLAPSDWNFDRFGQDTELNVHDAATKASMLEWLNKTNPAVYNVYTTTEDPDNFGAMTLGITDSGSLGIVPDEDASTTQRDFILDRIGYLVDTTVQDRNAYSSEFQEGIVQAAALLIGEEDDVVATFKQGASASSSAKPLAAMLFCYSWVDKYVKDKDAEDTPLDEDWREEVLPAPQDENSESTGNTTADEFLSSDTYKDLYDEITSDDIEEEYEIELDTYGSLLKLYSLIAGNYMKNVLSAGLEAIGYSGTDHPLVSGNIPEELSVFAAQALCGTDDSLTLEGAINKVNTAATFLGNSTYLRVHNNEVILSWLRAMDDDPIEDEPNDEPETTTTTAEKTTEAQETTSTKPANTGDESNVFGWMILAAAAGAVVVTCTVRRKKKDAR